MRVRVEETFHVGEYYISYFQKAILDFINSEIEAQFPKTFSFVTQSPCRKMDLRPAPKNLSFQILGRSSSLEEEEEEDEFLLYRSKSKLTQIDAELSNSPLLQENCNPNRRKHGGSKKKKKKKKKKQAMTAIECSISEDSIVEKRIDSTFVDIDSRRMDLLSENSGSCLTNRLESELKCQNLRVANDFGEEIISPDERTANVCRVVPGYQTPRGDRYSFGELRLRNLNGDDPSLMNEINVKEERIMEVNSEGKQRCEPNGCEVPRLETAGSLDWKQLIESDPKYMDSLEKSQVSYLMKEMFHGNSLQRTTILGSEKERERVYDTIFRLPWRCELLIDVGFFVCFDSFISLLTIMPMRMALIFWKLVIKREFKRPSAVELSDFGCFFIMACGVTLLQRTDISLIYHMIRGQGTIKLYVVYNVLEIFDKLCQSIGGDVLQTLFYSAEGLANSSPENVRYWIWRFVSDQALAVAASTQAITFSTCIVAHNNALLALLVSNNFSEIKSNVFKRFSKENIRSLAYFDSIERFHISAFVLFVLAQNILEAEGPWFETFLSNALLVYVCEMLIDIIKHSFLAKFNDVKPVAYSEFLEDLCQQALNKRSEDPKKNLTFIPLAPACVVIRVLTPLFAALLPCNPLPWRPFLIVLLIGISYVMLASLKLMIGMGLQKFSAWYIDRCQRRKHHLHSD